jgi:hypothetical protein
MTPLLRLVWAASILGLGLSGCSSKCTGSLGEVGKICPATFDGNLDSLSCQSPNAFERVYDCGDLILISPGPNLGGTICSYDATSHALVGAEVYGDTNSFCGGDSFAQEAGRLPPRSCVEAGPTTERECHGCNEGLLSEVGQGCPIAFAGDLEAVACGASWEERAAFTCDGKVVFTQRGPSSSLRCTFDAASHALLGADRLLDGVTSCPSGYSQHAGELAPACLASAAPTAQKFCRGQCSRALAEVGAHCPATFDGNLGPLACSLPTDFTHAYACDGLLAISTGPNLSSELCSYDAASHALVGATMSTDVAVFCDGNSFVATAGHVPPETCPEAASRTCPAP